MKNILANTAIVLSLIFVFTTTQQSFSGTIKQNERNYKTSFNGQQKDSTALPHGIYAELNTNKGKIILCLDYQHVPMTAANFVGLAEGKIKNDAFPDGTPYFNGTIWHRVVPGHVIQAGMPAGKDTMEGPGYEFPNEIYSGLSHNKAGMLGMANAGPNTNGSQFYITLGDRSYLDGNYTLFGHVVKGMDVVFNTVQGDTIKSVNIFRIGKEANDFKVTDESFRKMVDEAKAKVKLAEEKRLKDETETINKNWSDAQTTASGLKYVVTKEGTGDKLAEGATYKVKYTGRFLLGEKTFCSTSNGTPNILDEPIEFDYTVGKTKINPGIDEALNEMKPGEKRTVIVPSKLAYDIYGFYAKEIPGKKRFIISPNISLVYEIEVEP